MALRKVVENEELNLTKIEHRKILNYVEIGEIFGSEPQTEEGSEKELERDLDGEVIVDKTKRLVERRAVDDGVEGYDHNNAIDDELQAEMRRSEELSSDMASKDPAETVHVGGDGNLDKELEEELKRGEEFLVEAEKGSIWSEEEEDKEQLLDQKRKKKMRMYADDEKQTAKEDKLSKKDSDDRVPKGKDFKDMLSLEKQRQKGPEFADIDPAKIVITMDNEEDSESEVDAAPTLARNRKPRPKEQPEDYDSETSHSRVVERVVEKKKRDASSSSSDSSGSSDSSSSNSTSPNIPAQRLAKRSLPTFSNRTQVVKRSFEGLTDESRSRLELVQSTESPSIVISKPFRKAGLPGAAANGFHAKNSLPVSIRMKAAKRETRNKPVLKSQHVFRGVLNRDDDDALSAGSESPDDDIEIQYDNESDSDRDSPPRKFRTSNPSVKPVHPLTRDQVVARMRMGLKADFPPTDVKSNLASRLGVKPHRTEVMSRIDKTHKIEPLMKSRDAPHKKERTEPAGRVSDSLKRRLGVAGNGRSRVGVLANSDGDDRWTDDDEEPAIKKFATKAGDLRDRLASRAPKGPGLGIGMRADMESTRAQSRIGDLRARADGERKDELMKFNRVEDNLRARLGTENENTSLAYAIAGKGGKLRSDR